MAFRSKALCFVTAGILFGSAFGAPASFGASTPEELISQLADPDPARQADAKQKLIDLGDAAKPALERAAKSRAETATLLTAIETNKIAAPTYVTLKMDNATIDAVLKAMSKETGYSLKMFNQGMWMRGGNQQKISIDYNKTLFWEALKDLCRKAQITPYFNGGSGKQFLFLPAAQMGMSFIDCPTSVNGCVMIIFTNLSRQNSVTFEHNATSCDFSGGLMVMIEPKLHLLRYSYTPIIDQAMDDKGNSLVPPRNSGDSGWNGINRQMQLNLGMNLTYPMKNAGAKIAELRGRLKLTVVLKSEPLEFTSVNGEKEQTLSTPSGRRVTLISVKKSNEAGDDNRQFIAKVKLYRDKLSDEKFNELTNSPGITLLDSKGNELQFQGEQDIKRGKDEATIDFLFYRRTSDDGGGQDVGTPAKLVWDFVNESRDIDLPFEFKDLPIP